MKKKFVAALVCAAMAVGLLAGCGGNKSESASGGAAAPAESGGTEAADVDYGTGEIKIWVADNIVDFTKDTIATFQKDNPQYAGYKVTVEAVGEGDAAGNMITDVEAGADIFGFAQDQIARLVTAGALEEVAPDNVEAVESENDAGAVAAATVGDTL